MKEVQIILDEETVRDAKEKANRKRVRPPNPYDDYIKNITDFNNLPEIPK